MTIVVFSGPSLPASDARTVFDALYQPPAKAGDILRSLDYAPTAIGLIDGFFEVVPAVWHKEILYAMDQGVHVLGAASMGALRAAELAPLGMEGIGAIFQAYAAGTLTDDDEVAVAHGPAELGYPCLSEPMVNIRRTLSDALAAQIISRKTKEKLERIAKDLHYKDRAYGLILDSAERADLDAGELSAFTTWLPNGRFDQKRADALALVSRLSEPAFAQPREAPRYHFEATVFWSELTSRSELANP